MVDRRFRGDIAFAILVSFPMATFVRTGPATPTNAVVKISSAEPASLAATPSTDPRIGHLG